MRDERGQAAIEWVGLVLLAALAMGGVLAAGPDVDGRSFGGFLAHRIACAVRPEPCRAERRELVRAYGEEGAALVRRHAPGLTYEGGTLTLPVDWRRCRSHRCSDAPDDQDLDVHRAKRGGAPATLFTHLVRDGGETFIQYWMYYPDSTTTKAGAAGLVNRAGDAIEAVTGIEVGNPLFHLDDWESYQVRIDRKGRAWGRASSHHGYQGCKQARCSGRWIPHTGWTRVSYGSHAGHVPVQEGFPYGRGERDRPAYPGRDFAERTSTAEGIVLVPVETLDRSAYTALDPGITPPWRKDVWTDPRSGSTR